MVETKIQKYKYSKIIESKRYHNSIVNIVVNNRETLLLVMLIYKLELIYEITYTINTYCYHYRNAFVIFMSTLYMGKILTVTLTITTNKSSINSKKYLPNKFLIK
jgi:hypothetical protein